MKEGNTLLYTIQLFQNKILLKFSKCQIPSEIRDSNFINIFSELSIYNTYTILNIYLMIIIQA